MSDVSVSAPPARVPLPDQPGQVGCLTAWRPEVQWLGLAAIVVVALGFDFTNGFHDASNAIATSVSTRALTPRIALALGASMNFVGALLGTGVAATVGSGIIAVPSGTGGLVVVAAALFGGIAWNLVTWRAGLPSSSSHGLIGGLVGAALASGTQVKWGGLVDKVVIPMVLSPLVGFTLAFALMAITVDLPPPQSRPGRPRGFRFSQSGSAAAMALGHGLQDAQKTMGVIVLALVTVGSRRTTACRCGSSSCRLRPGCRDLGGWLADHADPGAAHRAPGPAAGVRRGVRGGERVVRDRVRVRRSGVHHPHHHLGGHGVGLGRSAPLRGALGCGAQHRPGLGDDHSGRGDRRGRVLLPPPSGVP